MELKQIKELIAAMEKAGLKKLSVKEKDGFEVHLEKECYSHSSPHPIPAPREYQHHILPAEMPKSPIAHSEREKVPEPKPEGKYVTAPIVGTFYGSPSPDDPPFIKAGDRVEENTVVCIIEAMKVMNEVKAGLSGTIAEICVQSGHPVEFGTKMFRIV